MKSFNVIKRNRKYFAAVLNGKFDCKILIDSNSESLELGSQELEVEDISVRTKYGTDLIFKLSAPAEEQKEMGIITLKPQMYNEKLVAQCHKLGGKWDSTAAVWVFSALVADKVEELDEKYNSTLISIEVKVLQKFYEYESAATIAGFTIARAYGRDSGAKIGEGIAFIEGSPDSGGSRKNWATVVKEGSVFRMQIPELCIPDIETDYFEVKKMGE